MPVAEFGWSYGNGGCIQWYASMIPIASICESVKVWADALESAHANNDWRRVDHVRLNMVHCVGVLVAVAASALPPATRREDDSP
jgi:hypothetical protein